MAKSLEASTLGEQARVMEEVPAAIRLQLERRRGWRPPAEILWSKETQDGNFEAKAGLVPSQGNKGGQPLQKLWTDVGRVGKGGQKPLR